MRGRWIRHIRHAEALLLVLFALADTVIGGRCCADAVWDAPPQVRPCDSMFASVLLVAAPGSLAFCEDSSGRERDGSRDASLTDCCCTISRTAPTFVAVDWDEPAGVEPTPADTLYLPSGPPPAAFHPPRFI